MLAPMAGFSDKPLRAVIKSLGADITVSEMISIHALVYDNAKTLKMLEANADEHPYALQLSGSKEDIMREAVLRVNELDFVDILDFNCGCPAPKVVNNGNGSALLKDLDKMVRLVNLMKEVSNKPVTLKLRTGFDKAIPNEIAAALSECPVEYCVVHGRTKVAGYRSDRIEYESIRIIKEQSGKKIIANGDLGAHNIIDVLGHTGADGAMIGRNALKTPWLFYDLRHNFSALKRASKVAKERGIALHELGDAHKLLGADTLAGYEIKRPFSKGAIVARHFKEMRLFYGARASVLFRKSLHLYARGMVDASEFRARINTIVDNDEMALAISDFFGTAG